MRLSLFASCCCHFLAVAESGAAATLRSSARRSFFTSCPTKPTVNELKFSCKLAAQQPQLMSARKPHPQRKKERRETHTRERQRRCVAVLCQCFRLCVPKRANALTATHALFWRCSLSHAHFLILSLLLLKCLSCCCSCRMRERMLCALLSADVNNWGKLLQCCQQNCCVSVAI